jgi:hypothetical protein
MKITHLPRDILNSIKNFLSYRERISLLLTCHDISTLKHSIFYPYRVTEFAYKNAGSTIQLCYNPFDPTGPVPLSFIGNNYINILIYDTPISYYNIRIHKKYEKDKTIEYYLRHYEKNNFYVNKITKYIS